MACVGSLRCKRRAAHRTIARRQTAPLARHSSVDPTPAGGVTDRTLQQAWRPILGGEDDGPPAM